MRSRRLGSTRLSCDGEKRLTWVPQPPHICGHSQISTLTRGRVLHSNKLWMPLLCMERISGYGCVARYGLRAQRLRPPLCGNYRENQEVEGSIHAMRCENTTE
eukprot:12993-Chlamydomonas_euryale.AAC.1